MNLKDYQIEALRTWQEQPLEDKIKNAMMGLMGEVGEYVDLNKKRLYHKKDITADAAIKELGDICYYWAVLCHDLKLDAEEISDNESLGIYSTFDAIVELHWCVDRIVFMLHYNNYVIESNTDRYLMGQRMAALWAIIKRIAEMHKVSIGEVMWLNIAKLRERHGEKWSGGQYNSKSEG